MRRVFLTILAIIALGLPRDAIAQSMGETEANQEVRDALLGFGDVGSKVRPVWHFAYPSARSKSASRRIIIDWLDGLGYGAERAPKGGVRFVKTSDPFARSFDVMTEQLAVALSKAGWEYDGWETQLIKQ